MCIGGGIHDDNERRLRIVWDDRTVSKDGCTGADDSRAVLFEPGAGVESRFGARYRDWRWKNDWAVVGNVYTGIDYSEGMIAAAKSLFPSADLRTMDARNVKFAEPFDCIMFSFNGIDSVAFLDRELIFQRMAASLRPGSYLIYSTHNIENDRVPVWLNHFFVKELFRSSWRIMPVLRSFSNRLRKYWRQHCDPNRAFAYVNDSGANFGYVNAYVDIPREIDTTLRRIGSRLSRPSAIQDRVPGMDRKTAGSTFWLNTVRTLASIQGINTLSALRKRTAVDAQGFLCRSRLGLSL